MILYRDCCFLYNSVVLFGTQPDVILYFDLGSYLVRNLLWFRISTWEVRWPKLAHVFAQVVLSWVHFRRYVRPEGLGTELPKMLKVPKGWDLIKCAICLTYTCKFDANNTPDAFKTSPGLLRLDPGPENMVY